VGRLFAWTFKERFPNHRIIGNVSCSTLFIHGECDGLIPAEHSLRLFKKCRARKLLITPPKMEHNSNLFGDASFLAVPAIHFFGFPGYYTSSPPRLPTNLFENPERERRTKMQDGSDSSLSQPWLCGCIAKSDPHHLDLSQHRQEQLSEDITIRLNENPGVTGEAESDTILPDGWYTDFVSERGSENKTFEPKRHGGDTPLKAKDIPWQAQENAEAKRKA